MLFIDVKSIILTATWYPIDNNTVRRICMVFIMFLRSSPSKKRSTAKYIKIVIMNMSKSMNITSSTNMKAAANPYDNMNTTMDGPARKILSLTMYIKM
ncbi:hypothetical protein DSECCO2_529410 [anaerobic digester metagenome]